MKAFDILVLTAANENQAKGYRTQLAWRQQRGWIPSKTEVFAIADPDNRRVGSLGSTLYVLSCLRRRFGDLSGKRIFLCPSGGDSRRTPAYAAQGKIFTPVPCSSEGGKPTDLFDLILHSCESLPAPDGGQVLIASGDVLLTFDSDSVDFSHPGVNGVAYYDGADVGSRHGVYLPDDTPVRATQTICSSVRDFLQKPSEAEARASGAVTPFGFEAIDTGLLSLDIPFCNRLLEIAGDGSSRGLLADIVRGATPSIDLYEELTMALVPSINEESFLTRCVTRKHRDAAHRTRMRRWYRMLRGTEFHVNILPYCEFFHLGSSAELLEGLTGLSRTSVWHHFTNGSGTNVASSGMASHVFVFNSCISRPLVSRESALVEGCDLLDMPPPRLDGKNILTGVPSEATAPIRLPHGIGLVCLPIGKQKWTALVYGIHDTFKAAFSPDDSSCTFLNRPFMKWIELCGIAPDRIWKKGETSEGLWRARLWPIGEIDEVLNAVQTYFSTVWGSDAGLPVKRYSLAELLPQVNQERLLRARAEIRRKVELSHIAERVAAHDTLSADEICEKIRTDADATYATRRLTALLKTTDSPLFKARVLTLRKAIRLRQAGDTESLPHSPEAAAAVAQAVATDFEPVREPRPAGILQDQVVWVTSPARIDLGGGWTDTPPICTERGGTVLNAAVTLNGQYPIQAIAKLNTLGCIRLFSIDLGERKEIRTTAELLDHSNPYSWDALAKAALVLTGIAPADPNEPLQPWLRRLGGGLDLTIFSSLPKGSGMGTSSILGATVIACLDRVLGIPCQHDRLVRLTSILEQRMSTGGGWQDQVGGIMPGIKWIRTEPGYRQDVTLRWSDRGWDSQANRECCLLYFTGQKRLARNILANVVTRYLARDPVTLQTIQDLKRNVAATKEAMDAKDWDGFADGINGYWELKKRIDPGSTNPAIERILASVQQDTRATLLPGAGGGGFIFLIARSVESARRIRAKLERTPPNPQARFFDFAIDQQGLKVTVL